MVRLTDAIIKAQGASANEKPRRPRSTSQQSKAQQDEQKISKKQAPITIVGDKLSLNYQDITSLQIDRQGYSATQQQALAFQFAKVKKLFLSHNNLTSLDGIANFPNLTHLSISQNKLWDINELAKIGGASAAHGTANNASKLLCLAIKGNFFLERHPDYKALVIRHFINLRELDSQLLQASGPQQISLRGQIREGMYLKHSLIPFLVKLDRSLQALTIKLNGGACSELEKVEIVQKWSQLTNHKDFIQRAKIPQRVITASQLRAFIKVVDCAIFADTNHHIKVQRSELHDVFQWLYQEIILKLSTELKSTDLVKYLNFTILQKYPQLADYINVKNQIDPSKQLSQMDQRQVEKLCTLLDRDPQISLEMLLAEQLNQFYSIQPEMSTIQDYTTDLTGGIEVVEQQPLQPDAFIQTPTTQILNQLTSALKEANKTPSPNTAKELKRRMVVENSASSLDHPVILKNQKELTEQSKQKGTEPEVELFSFRNTQNVSDILQKFSTVQENDQTLNDQNFLIEPKNKVDKHRDSPVRRNKSPTLKSFFKIKQSAETEILPSRQACTTLQGNTSMLTTLLPPKSGGASLKMNIPKNYFSQHQTLQQEKGLGPHTLGRLSHTVSDSFQLPSNDPIMEARGMFSAQPEQQIVSAEAKQIFAKFLQEECDEVALSKTKDCLRDKALTQFPIFALNEDYMRAIAIIIMDKVERAQILIKHVCAQIYSPQEEQASVLNQTLQSTQSSGPKKKLTQAEKEKLSLIKRKMQEKKELSRSVTFNDDKPQNNSPTFVSGGRSQSRGSAGSKDSCFSPVNRRRQHLGSQQKRSLSRNKSNNSSQQQNSRVRVYGSEVLREQSLEHQRLTDEQSAELWVQKKLARQQFANRMKKLVIKLELIEQRTKQQALYLWIRFAQRLHHLEHFLSMKQREIHKEKAFFFWMAAFRQSVELTKGLRTLQTKKKVWYQLVINRKQAQLNKTKVDTYCRQKLLLKSFYGFLKILESNREEKRKKQEADQKLKYEKLQRDFSPPTYQGNRLKRTRSKNSNKDKSGLGLINVNPVIDKQLDGVYDLEVVEMQQHSNYPPRVMTHGQPLLNAVRSQVDLRLHDSLQQEAQIQGDSKTLIKTNRSRKDDRTSAYFTKQVNFFKLGNSSIGGKTFVQDNKTNRSAFGTTLSNKNRSKSGSRNRSNSRNNSLNRSKTSILKKVYGEDKQNNSVRWSVKPELTNASVQVDLTHVKNEQTNANIQTDLTLDNSFGKLMVERMKTEDSSYLDFNTKSGQALNNISASKKKRSKSRSGSRSSKMKKSNFSSGPSKTEQSVSSVMTFRPSQINTTHAKARQSTIRVNSRSADRNRMNCGNLSRSIQDQQPKSYEKTTVSYVSKVIASEKQSSQSSYSSTLLFKHLKNATMGGSGDFFKSGTTSASNKKQNNKLLIK